MRACQVNILIFLLIVQLSLSFAEAPSSLKLAVIVFRHGDRTPTHILPNDVNQADAWPQGLGQLTMTGVTQQFAIGQFFRTRYDGFIDKKYIHSQIHVRSTDVDRTLMSAQAMLSGFYHPVHPDQMWRQDLPWIPIPIHTVPTSQDYVYKSGNSYNLSEKLKNCPSGAGQHDVLETEEAKAFLKEHEETFAYLRNHSHPTDYFNITQMADTLIVEKAHGKTFPDYVTEELYNKLYDVIIPEFQGFMFNKSELGNFKHGIVVYEIADLFKMKLNNTLDKDIRAFFISAHDTTLLSILASLDLYNSNKQVIPYSATIMFELHHDDIKGWYVQMFYKNSTQPDAQLHKLTIPGCLEDCPISKFLNITGFYSRSNWEKLCLPPRVFRIESLKEITILSVVSGVALLFLLLCVTLCCFRACCRRRRRASQRTYGRLRATELSRPEEVPMISSNSLGSDLDE